MASEDDLELDLPAAALRGNAAEVSSSVEVLAAALESALPGMTSVERQKVGGFRSKHREVGRIAVALGDEQFELARAPEGMRCTRNRVVRGITLSREQLPLADWVAALLAGVSAHAQLSERDRAALEGLLR
jgi:hypothetical protein